VIKRLVVDDIREPRFSAVVARTATEALDMIRKESWDEVWLDHDADFVPGQDYSWTTARIKDLCKRRMAPDVGLFVMHSANTHGRMIMRGHLREHYPVVDIEDYSLDRSLSLWGADRVWDVSVEKGVHHVLPDGKIQTLDEYYKRLRPVRRVSGA